MGQARCGAYLYACPEQQFIDQCSAGGGFMSFKLPGPLRILSLGICMDLNPQNSPEWNLRTGPYEIADYCSAKGTNVLIMLNSWLDSGHNPESKHDHETLRYWGARLRPLWDDDEDPDGYAELHRVPGEENPETIVVLCNRTGTENGTMIEALLCLHC